MNKFKFSAVILAVCAVLSAVPAGAVSLWNDNRNWIADARPGRVGDIVTVMINERTDAKDEAKMNVTKSSSGSVSDGTGILSFIRGLSMSASSSGQGDGSIERKHHATTTMTCIVTEILPNGNLVIEGTRDVHTSDEILQFQLIGVIRPQDVDGDNRIQSNLIANAELAVKGRGTVSRTQKPGIISQILQIVF